eukprot:6554177-Pyramimonas_sp.AAC.1
MIQHISPEATINNTTLEVFHTVPRAWDDRAPRLAKTAGTSLTSAGCNRPTQRSRAAASTCDLDATS